MADLLLKDGHRHSAVAEKYGRGLDEYLHDPAKNPVQWATLSHRWGTAPSSKKLLHTNLQAWKRDIPDSDLRQTFRDAIHICRNLDIEYIWIDSLCIIQDSREDWQYECSRMEWVYALSRCNITATAATDDDGGCFKARSAESDLPLRLVIRNPSSDHDQSAHEDRRYPAYETFDLHETQTWLNGVERAPVNRRAWVLQEVGEHNPQQPMTILG